ncbi:OmpA family protein [Magnetovibrio sp. PR-2]|uniref:OmpA family protein n=1 Tax=Magnetovibrio sp. PR-2 TaxID=3120356 RepID=UPI002FCE3637
MGKKAPPAGAPMWMVTFADLMALLLTLFVLLLTFSEMDVIKYQSLAGSLSEAFGTSETSKLSGMIEIDGAELRRSASEIAPPDDTQTENMQEDADYESQKEKEYVASYDLGAMQEEIKEEARRQQEQKLEELSGMLKKIINDEVAGSGITVEKAGNEVVIRFPNEIAFPSGGGDLTFEFASILDKLAPALVKTKGTLIVSGHTDNIPVSSDGRYRSNWELSAARATSVVHQLLEYNGIAPERITIQGYGESRPLVANDNATNRAKNRRVEISVRVEQ